MGAIETLRGHGAVVVAVIISVIVFYLRLMFLYCLRLFMPSWVRPKILSFESIMGKELSPVQL